MAQLSMREQGEEGKISVNQDQDLTCSPKPEDDVLAVQMLLRLLVCFVVLVTYGAGDLVAFVTLRT